MLKNSINSFIKFMVYKWNGLSIIHSLKATTFVPKAVTKNGF